MVCGDKIDKLEMLRLRAGRGWSISPSITIERMSLSAYPRMKYPEIMKTLCCLILTMSMVCFACVASAATGRKQVLYINSYQNGYAWSDNILAGIRERLRESDYTIDLQVEYMDAKKHPARSNRALLKRLFANKFAESRFDAIICSDNDAFQFMLSYHDVLFPGVPVVFCGVNDWQPEVLERQQGVTGIVERLGIRETLETALRLNPLKRKVIVVGDPSLTSRAIAAQIKAVVPDFIDRLEFSFWENIPLNELLSRSRNLPDDTLLFFIPVYVESEGKYLSAGEVVEALYENANVPIYGAWKFLLGHGIVGGHLLDGVGHGKAAANMVLKILDGLSPADIPTAYGAPSGSVFDWKVLEKFGMDIAVLPFDAQFINRPELTYQLEKRVVWTVGVALCVLTLFTLLLGASRNRALRAERELALSRAMLRSIIDTIPQLLYWKDSDNRFKGVNRRFADFFGLSRLEEAEGKRNNDVIHEKQFSRKSDDLDRIVMDRGLPVLREILEYDAPDRPGMVFEMSKIPLHDDKGNISGVLSTAEDITARVVLEQQLIQSQKMEAVGTFVGGIAHDFNNLLTTIINSTELALMEIEAVDAAEDVLRAKLAAQQGSQLVSQLLTFSRPSNRDAMRMDAAETVTKALNLVAPLLPDSIVLKRDIPPDILEGVADPSQLQQVVMNLCTNAIHALKESGGVLIVSVSVDEGRQRNAQSGLAGRRLLRLKVRDNGPGISPNVRDRIFDPFFTTKKKHEGTGLGLAIVQGIVHGHGGHIRLVSHPGLTLFDIAIPFEKGESAPVISNTTNFGGEERILFVEDDPEQLVLIPRALSLLGYKVTAVQGGRAALDVLMGGTRFDMIVTDFDMPGFDGVELARTVRQLFPGIPVILVSGGQDAVAAADGDPGIIDVLMKPYTGSALAERMRRLFDVDSNA